MAKPQGTYMLFLDCTDGAPPTENPGQLLQAGWNVGVAWQDGRMFHGPCAIRMNLRCPCPACRRPSAAWEEYVFNGPFLSERN